MSIAVDDLDEGHAFLTSHQTKEFFCATQLMDRSRCTRQYLTSAFLLNVIRWCNIVVFYSLFLLRIDRVIYSN